MSEVAIVVSIHSLCMAWVSSRLRASSLPSALAFAERYVPGRELNVALLANKEFVEFVNGRTPMRRWGKPRELAGAAIYLASDASSFVNGHTLYVDGGMSTSV